MLRLSLDTNCIIAAEMGEPRGSAVRALVLAHREGRCEVAVLDVSASENRKRTGEARVASAPGPWLYRDHEDRLRRLGWSHLPCVPMTGVWDMSYWDTATWAGSRDPDEIRRIWSVICPKHPFPEGHQDLGGPVNSKMRNRLCDVLLAHDHLKARRDIFVTMNCRDFQRNAGEIGLCALGPQEALARIGP